MARIIVGSYIVRFPVGGYMSWVLQWLLGFKGLGHDVYFVEKSGWPDACFDPVQNTMSDDCTQGIATLARELDRFGLSDRWCFVDIFGHYYGMSKQEIESAFRSADMFVDMGSHGSWLEEASRAGTTVLVDGEPGYTQMKLARKALAGEAIDAYDQYYTVGLNVGHPSCHVPTLSRKWHSVFDPVYLPLFRISTPPAGAPFTTVMSWQAHDAIEFEDKVYGQKDVEFHKFVDLPNLVSDPLEIAVAGQDVPRDSLHKAGWHLRDAHQASLTLDAFYEYVQRSKGEFSVCKNVFVETVSGWFSDRSAVYLASGRPVVIQDTGFSGFLPCGRGLFAVKSPEEAADAIRTISADWPTHSRAAREIAEGYLDARIVLRKFVDEVLGRAGPT